MAAAAADQSDCERAVLPPACCGRGLGSGPDQLLQLRLRAICRAVHHSRRRHGRLDAELAKANDPAATLASNGYRLLHREPNNKQRKRCYRHVAIRVLAYTLREPLPHCVVTRIRIVWPSTTGVYMGYKGC